MLHTAKDVPVAVYAQAPPLVRRVVTRCRPPRMGCAGPCRALAVVSLDTRGRSAAGAA
jgi:hypothetical protein